MRCSLYFKIDTKAQGTLLLIGTSNFLSISFPALITIKSDQI